MPSWQYYWNPWFRERHVYSVPLPPARCRELLREGTTVFLGATVGRRVFTGDDLWLYRVTFYANNSRPYARVRCRPAPDGSTVDVTIGLRRISKIVAAVWFGFIALWTLGGASSAVANGQLIALLVVPAVGAAFAGIGLLMVAFTRLLARGDPEFLLDYIKYRLNIRVTS